MKPEVLVQNLKHAQEFFHRSSDVLTEEDSTFTPAEGMMTAAQQVAHTAQTIDWFLEGAFREEGFDMDFEVHIKAVSEVTSLAAAREWLDRAFDAACEAFGSKTPEELLEPLPPGPVMGGSPRLAVVSGIEDHTAHHRGALTVYARLLGKEPKMPYMD